MKPDLSAYLGQRVQVVVDRPLGSVHPRCPEQRYPVNYGEVPGTVSGDGHPIDAYLLGWDEPVGGATGTVVAVLVRADDTEDKLVVARDGTHWTAATVRQAVEFQERYFHTRVILAPG